MSKIDQKPGIRDLEGIFSNRSLSAKITRHCSDYSRLHYFHPDQSDGKKYFDEFPSAKIREMAFTIEAQFKELILGECVHAVPLRSLDTPQWQEHWRLITWFLVDVISERFFMELDGLGISELPTLHEYTTFSQGVAREVLCPDLLEKLDGSLRVAKSRSKGGVERRIKMDTIKSKLDGTKEPNTYVRAMLQFCDYAPANARAFVYSAIILKLLHQIFSESNLFKKPMEASTDFCNYLHYFSRLPVPDANPVDAYASSNFESMANDPSGRQWTYPLRKAWVNQHHKNKKYFTDTFADGALFAPMKATPPLTLEKHLSNTAAFTCALCILRCGFNGPDHTEKTLRALLSLE